MVYLERITYTQGYILVKHIQTLYHYTATYIVEAHEEIQTFTEVALKYKVIYNFLLHYNTGLNIFDIKIFNLITNGKSKINSDTQENMRVNKTIVKFQIFIHPCSSEDWYVVSSSASITKRTTFWKLSIFLFIWVFKWPTAMYAFNHGAR